MALKIKSIRTGLLSLLVVGGLATSLLYAPLVSAANKVTTSKTTTSTVKEQSTADIGPLPDLIPNPDFGRASVITALILSTHGYDKQGFTPAMSDKIFKEYFDTLDPQRMFLLQSDIDQYEKEKPYFGDMIKHGNFDTAFAIYKLYRERVQKRYEWVFALLNQPFDFTTNETYKYDRKKDPFEKSMQDLDNVWRKRIKNDYLRLKLAGQSDGKIVDRLKRRYLNNEKYILRNTTEDVSEEFINAYASSTDPHTTYYSPTSAKNFNVQLSLSVEGIGAVLQKRDEYGQIREVVAGGPAAKSKKINPGDRIVGVAQGDNGPMEDVIDWRLDDIVKKIRGNRGSVVRIELIPAEGGLDGKTKIVRLVREKVMMEDQAARLKKQTVEINGQKRIVGIIDIPSFYEDFEGRSEHQKDYKSVTRDVKKMLEELNKENAVAVVLDLRANGGGSLNEAANLSGLFLGPRQTIVQVKDADGDINNVRSDSQNIVWTKPVVVIVNRLSASASEIFAAAMQDYNRGVVVGDGTWGKGTVQTVADLASYLRHPEQYGPLGMIKWTIQKFFRVNGASTQLKGVTPDITFPAAVNNDELGESSYPNAMPWTVIEPTSHQSYYKNSKELISQLKQMHQTRIKDSASWKLLEDETAYSNKLSNRKETSLNYAQRVKERKEMEAMRKQFNQRRKDLGESDVGVFKLDDGLQYDEGNLKEELADEKKLKENIDTPAREAANIAADFAQLLNKK